jgi:hypothetical protein
MVDSEIITWLTGDGDFMVMLVRLIFLVFAMQFMTGLTYILAGVRDSCL